MFLSLDGTFWIQVLNFFVFYAALSFLYIKPAAAALRKRRLYIDSVQAEYEAALQQVKDLKAKAESKRFEARREGDQAAGIARAEAQRTADATTLEAQARASQLIEEAHEAVAAELKVARIQEEMLIEDLAQSMLSRAVGSV